MNYLEQLKRLCATPAPSGYEFSAARRIALLLERYLETVEIDALGNVIGLLRCGKKNAKTVLLDAHIDEIGLIVSGHKDGFLQFEPLGGVDLRILPGREVQVCADTPMLGVVTCMPPHLQTRAETEKAIKKDALHIDVGLSQEEALEKAPIGTPIVFAADCVQLQNKCISGRALDDRACFCAILRTLELISNAKRNVDVVVVGSVQEELGCRGARVAGFAINPDYAIAVDVTHGNTPDAPRSKTFEVGGGTVIGIGPNLHPGLTKLLTKLAKEKKIPHQIEVCEGNTGTNAWVLQTVREGIKTGLLSVPLKYMHTPVETLCEKDLEATAKLLASAVLALGEEGRRV